MTPRKKGPLLRKSWEEIYKELVEYHKAHHGNINDITHKTHLGRWMHHNRRERKALLTDEQVDKLNRLGVKWEQRADKNEKRWQVMYRLLLEYKQKHGRINVTRPEVFQGEKLGMWVCVQRNMYRDGQIKAHRQKLLDEIGFLWTRNKSPKFRDDSKQEARWNYMYQQLLDYREKNGHLFVPATYKKVDEETHLGRWVTTQRQVVKNGNMRVDRRKRLDDIGFVSKIGYDASAYQQVWDRMLAKLVQYKLTHGHTRVPNTRVPDADGKDLGRWVERQRYQFRKGTLNQNRREQLEALGFQWEAGFHPKLVFDIELVSEDVGSCNVSASLDRQAWDGMFTTLLQYKRIHGHTRVPGTGLSDEDGEELGRWVEGQRAQFNKKTLPRARRKRLQALGFAWDADDNYWESMFHHLHAFKRKHGHTRVRPTHRTIDGSDLGGWVMEQLLLYQAGKLRVDRMESLMALRFRFRWRFSDERWNTKYRRLKHCKEKRGGSRVPEKSDTKSVSEDELEL